MNNGQGMLLLTVQGVTILGMTALFHFIDPWCGRVVAYLGVLWLVLVVLCHALDLWLKARIGLYDWQWRRRHRFKE